MDSFPLYGQAVRLCSGGMLLEGHTVFRAVLLCPAALPAPDDQAGNALIKGIGADSVHAFGNGDGFQALAAGKNVFFDFDHAVGDEDTFQSCAAGKEPCTHPFQIPRQGHCFQGGTFTECAGTDSGDTVGEGDGLEAGAGTEGFFSDFRDAVRDFDALQGGILKKGLVTDAGHIVGDYYAGPLAVPSG